MFFGLARVSLRLGEYDFSSEEDCSPDNSTVPCPGPLRDYAPSEFVLHSGFNLQDKTEFRNDIALIRLQTKVELSGTDMNIQTRLQLTVCTEWSKSTYIHTYTYINTHNTYIRMHV